MDSSKVACCCATYSITAFVGGFALLAVGSAIASTGRFYDVWFAPSNPALLKAFNGRVKILTYVGLGIIAPGILVTASFVPSLFAFLIASEDVEYSKKGW